MAAEATAMTRPLRVLMTADTAGGVWQYALQLAGSLTRGRRAQVALATMGAPPTPSQCREAGSIPDVTVHASSFRLEWMSEPWEDIALAGKWLLALEDQFAPDVVHLNQFAFGATSFKAPTLLVAHSCVVSWWQAVHGTEPPAQWDHYRESVRAGLAAADLVAAPTRDMLMSLARNHGFRGAGLVLPNGRDPHAFKPGRKRPLIISAGRLWDEAKNIRALECIAPEVPWPIEVAGATRSPDGLVWHSDGLCLLGELSAGELAGRLADASICAHPSRYEPFGLAPLEAALAGCALVLSDLASLREIWGAAAVYVPPDDHAALAAALKLLIADADLLGRMSQRARAVALRYSGATMAAAYDEAYSTAASAAGTRLQALAPIEDTQCAS